jgi:hypothetical protein
MSLQVSCDGKLQTSCDGNLLIGWIFTIQGLNLNTACWLMDGYWSMQSTFYDLDGNQVTSIDGTYNITCKFSVPAEEWDDYGLAPVKIGEHWLNAYPSVSCSGQQYSTWPVKGDLSIGYGGGRVYISTGLGFSVMGFDNLFEHDLLKVGIPMANKHQTAPANYRPTAGWGGTAIIQ